jgi:mono/diheme cytochrome c family protein
MTSRRTVIAGALALMIGSCLLAIAQERKETASAAAPASPQKTAALASRSGADVPTAATHGRDTTRVLDESAMRIEGEKRFRTNCGRCHMAPHKFPPRTMAMIVRHMRVRAMITDEDMRLILNYMTQ